MDRLKILIFRVCDDSFEVIYHKDKSFVEKVKVKGNRLSDYKTLVQKVRDILPNECYTDLQISPFRLFNPDKPQVFLLPENESEFLKSQILLHEFSVANENGMRIIHRASLNALWEIVAKEYDYAPDLRMTLNDGKFLCEFECGEGVIEIISIEEVTDANGQEESDERMIKGGILYQSLIDKSDPNRKKQGLLLLDIIEYDILILLEKDGYVRDFITLVAHDTTIPTRKSEDVPTDIFHECNVYLQVGKEKVNIDLKKYIESIPKDGNVTITMEIDSNKKVKVYFDYNGDLLGQCTLGSLLAHDAIFSKVH